MFAAIGYRLILEDCQHGVTAILVLEVSGSTTPSTASIVCHFGRFIKVKILNSTAPQSSLRYWMEAMWICIIQQPAPIMHCGCIRLIVLFFKSNPSDSATSLEYMCIAPVWVNYGCIYIKATVLMYSTTLTLMTYFEIVIAIDVCSSTTTAIHTVLRVSSLSFLHLFLIVLYIERDWTSISTSSTTTTKRSAATMRCFD